MWQGRVWLCVGPVLLCLLDGGLTLQGQPDVYWAGHYEHASELNPLGRWPLERHPLLFAAALLCWVVLFCASLFYLSDPWARPASLAVQFGHTVGAASWLLKAGAFGWLAGVLLFSAALPLLDRLWRSSRPPAPLSPAACRDQGSGPACR